MLTGWFSGHFGIFVAKEVVANPPLNYAGLALSVLSIAFFFPIKPTASTDKKESDVDEASQKLINQSESDEEDGHHLAPAEPKKEGIFSIKKVIGIGLSLVAGLFYGANMVYPLLHNLSHP